MLIGFSTLRDFGTSRASSFEKGDGYFVEDTNLYLIFVLLAAFALPGCAAHEVREAQTAFDRAARIESEIQFRGDATDPAVLSTSSALNDYRIALSIVNDALTNHEAELTADELLGTTLMLKALCLWRIGDLSVRGNMTAHERLAGAESPEDSEDEFTATLARLRRDRNALGMKLGPRDLVLLTALDGLRDHDRGLLAKDWPTADRFFRSSLAVLDASLTEVNPPADHPIRIYVRLAQLSTCKAWLTATDIDNPGGSELDRRTTEITQEFKRLVDEVRSLAVNDDGLKNAVNLILNRAGQRDLRL